MELNEQRGDMSSFRLIEDQTRRCVLDHLQTFHSTGWETSLESVAVVKAGDDHSLHQELGGVWVRYGPIFLMISNAKRHDRATEAT